MGGSVHGVLPADGVLVDWDVQGPSDPPLHCRGHVAVLRLRDSFSITPVALFVVSVTVLITLRFYIAYFVVFAALATFVFGQRRGAVRAVFTYSLLALLLLGALTIVVKRETLELQTTYLTLDRLQVTREDQAMWGRSGFGQEYDVSTTSGALATIPVGLVYLLFAPFPWSISGLRQALVVPETLIWYALMPAFVRGLTIGLKRHFRDILPITVFAVTLILRLRHDARKRRNRVPAADASLYVLLRLHGCWDRREATPARAVCDPRRDSHRVALAPVTILARVAVALNVSMGAPEVAGRAPHSLHQCEHETEAEFARGRAA